MAAPLTAIERAADELHGQRWKQLGFEGLLPFEKGHVGVFWVIGEVMNGGFDPLSFEFAGNIISIPQVSSSDLAALTLCDFGEFGAVLSEPGLNSPSGHDCIGTVMTSWVVARNAAFTGAPGSGPRAVVELLTDAYPADDARTFMVGEMPSTLPLALEVTSDFGSLPRGTPPGVGAWAPRP